ncbi:MAG: ComEC family competence protein [Bacteroidetes bacterium]|nr:MAG: ComEC family competence protein [Bacteroidota bacterium]
MQSERLTGIIRLLPAFLGGIFFSMYFQPANQFLLILLLVSLAAFAAANFFLNARNSYSYRWLSGILIHLSIFTCAALVSSLKKEITFKNHFSKNIQADAFLAELSESPLNKGNNFRFEVEISTLKIGSDLHNVNGKCLVYVRKDSSLINLEYGDQIVFLKRPLDIKAPLNPGAFNFQSWLRNKQIYHQVFLKSSEFIIIQKEQGSAFMRTAISWRNYLLKAIRKAGITGQEEAVLSALILGQDDEIDSELRQSYSTAGVMHILAVSGMHVGLIYAALCLLIRFPGKNRKFKWIKTVFLIICLWFYAMLTGLSPSVLRAAMMLTFLVVGISLGRSSNPLNILSASAICLFIIFSPNLIHSAGFQLSYLAVGGILFLYKPLHSIYIPKTWLTSQIWSILAVSLVAQVATFPLSLYYFHRFPNYFLLSNLLVIPLGTVVIFGGIIVLFFSWWPFVSLFLGKVLSTLIYMLNSSVAFLGNLPGSSTDSVYLSLAGMSLLYVSIILLTYYFLKVRPWYFLSFLLVMLFFYTLLLTTNFRSMQQKFMLVFHCPKQTYIQFFQGRNVISVCDSLLASNAASRQRISENFMLERGVLNELIISSENGFNECRMYRDLIINLPFIQFGKDKLFLLSGSTAKYKPDSDSLDYVLVSLNPKVKPESWLEGVKCKTLIVDASNSPWKIEAWKLACERRGISFINVTESGAFILEK